MAFAGPDLGRGQRANVTAEAATEVGPYAHIFGKTVKDFRGGARFFHVTHLNSLTWKRGTSASLGYGGQSINRASSKRFQATVSPAHSFNFGTLPAMWLILANATDLAGPWLAAGLAARTHLRVQRLTEHDLASAETWEHENGGDNAWVRLVLADGRCIDSREVTGVVNLLAQPPFARPPVGFRGRNHAHAVEELKTLLTSSLASSGCPHLSAPGVQESSRNYHQSEWMMLAAAAGLPIQPRTFFSRNFYSEPAEANADESPASANRLLIIGENVLHLGSDDSVPKSIRSAAIRFASVTQNQILELHFRRDGTDGWIFHHVLPCADLIAGGDAALDAFASSLLAPTDSMLQFQVG
jgi:hypothetical protein